MWVWIENKSDGISFVFALFLSLFPSRLLFFLMSYLFFSDWKQILRIWFYSHALVSMNNEVCRFCEKMTREKHKDWLLLRNQLIFCLVIFHSLSLSLFFSIVFSRWFFDFKPFRLAQCDQIRPLSHGVRFNFVIDIFICANNKVTISNLLSCHFLICGIFSERNNCSHRHNIKCYRIAIRTHSKGNWIADFFFLLLHFMWK